VPHRATQEGNRHEAVFYVAEDYQTYLEWLSHYSQQHQLEILAYSLMTNHIHLVVVPADESSLQYVLKPLHMRYAQRINQIRKWRGHFWQGRYFSSPMDERFMWSAIRYVECNPVRARMVRKAEEYPWLSAVIHCRQVDDGVLSDNPPWKKLTEQVDDGSAWFAEGDDPSELAMIRRNLE
jgi:putative transposase